MRSSARLHTSSYEPIAERGKQHNPVTGSGGMLLGRVLQVAPRASGRAAVRRSDRDARLALAHAAARRPRSARCAASAQLDVEGEAVLFASGAYAKMPDDLARAPRARGARRRGRRAAGRAPREARAAWSSSSARGARAASCAPRRRVGAAVRARASSASRPRAPPPTELRALGLCDAVVSADARDPSPCAARSSRRPAGGGAT